MCSVNLYGRNLVFCGSDIPSDGRNFWRRVVGAARTPHVGQYVQRESLRPEFGLSQADNFFTNIFLTDAKRTSSAVGQPRTLRPQLLSPRPARMKQRNKPTIGTKMARTSLYCTQKSTALLRKQSVKASVSSSSSESCLSCRC
jgi:hypothetical protein